ncbi:MAG TPA: DUF5671 domain-containing protein, partial [Candidatus Paceibacterota bacterium]|nr:DUF5671 domain-containing protein [Candidatus Paceibacterota bacterium]
TLYITAFSLLALLFQVINHAFPDALSAGGYFGAYGNPYSAAVRWSIASVVVTFPIFWFVSWELNREYAIAPEKKSLGVRRWLVYFTLFIAGITIMIDLIVLLNTFLGGEITARFVLKVLAVLLVAGLIFGYYIYDLKKYPSGPSKALRNFMLTATLIILASIAGGFAVMGSPMSQRNAQFDSRRVSDLMGIQSEIVSYWQRKGALPQNLDALNDPIASYAAPADPQTGASYEYKQTGALSFELCATFRTASNPAANEVPPMYPGASNDVWTHGAGRQCFDRTIDPQLYPPVNQTGQDTGIVPRGATQTNGNLNGPDYFPNGGPGTNLPEQE